MVVKYIVSSILQIWYVEVRIFRRISDSPLNFEVTGVDCIIIVHLFRMLWAFIVCPYIRFWWGITNTYLYNFDPLKPHFYIVKLGFTGVYIIFLISAQNIDYGYSLEQPRRGGSNEYSQSMFWVEIWKISDFFYMKIFIFWWKNFQYI